MATNLDAAYAGIAIALEKYGADINKVQRVHECMLMESGIPYGKLGEKIKQALIEAGLEGLV